MAMGNLKSKINNIIKRNSFLSAMKLAWFKHIWHKSNLHNFTEAANCFNRRMVIVGNGTYGQLNVRHFGNQSEKLKIGNYCSIGPNVSFILGGEHDYLRISTYPFSVKYGIEQSDSITRGPILVDDDVWIGYGATIMSGVSIGQGAVVAAGAVVTKNVPPYAIVGGVPAKVIKYRFDSEMINSLLKINYSKLTKTQIQSHIEELNKPLKDVGQLDWMEKK